jgi:Trk K+ transport system NAD-binding subunit
MKIIVVGLGYVGLSNAVLLAQHNEVIGVDVSQERVDAWRAPIGWSSLNVSALSAFGPSERCFLVQADDSPMNCVA